MGRILVVEDDDAVRAFVLRALSLDGHAVDSAEDGEVGFDRLQEAVAQHRGYDLMLSDIKMPFMDGIELAGHAATIAPDMPVMLMTGYADQRERAESVKAIDVILKPFTLAEIRKATATILQRADQRLAG